MRGFFSSTLAFGGASLGWWLGARVDLVFALLLSSIGMGVGGYYGKKWTV